MRQSTVLRSFVLIGLLGVVALATSGCGGGGAAGTDDLILEKFLLVDQNLNNIGGSGATNTFRDTRILFVFNVPVDPATVSDRTIRIGIPTGDGLLLEAPGRFEIVDGAPNQVLFDPTYTRNNETDVQDNPFGLEGDALYQVIIPSVADSPKHVKNQAGKGVISRYETSFTTNDEYLQNFQQPELESTKPSANQTEVDPTADIILTFTQPMKPDTFRLGDTVIIRDLTNEIDVLGTLRFSSDAKSVSFRPVFGYGKGPNTIFVRVKTDVANLPGNPIPREVRFTFTTARDSSQPDFADITEPFESNTFEDRAYGNYLPSDPKYLEWGLTYPLADWNEGITSGLLAGSFTTGSVELSQGTSTYLWPPFAWGQNYAGQFQYLYLSSEIGTSRSITGFSWYYRCLTSSAVTNVSMNVGHTQQGSLTTSFASNFSDTPVAVVSNLNSYSIPNVPSEGWLAMPTFTQNFKYNGSDNVILEIFCTCGPNGQNNTTWTGLWRVTTGLSTMRAAYTQPSTVGGGTPTTNGYFLDTRIQYLIDRSEARSLFYDTELASPQFLEAVFFPGVDSQPAGTVSTWEFRAGPPDPENPDQADLDKLTQWTNDLRKLSGFRYVQFQVQMKGNETTAQVPTYEEVILPFIFF